MRGAGCRVQGEVDVSSIYSAVEVDIGLRVLGYRIYDLGKRFGV